MATRRQTKRAAARTTDASTGEVPAGTRGGGAVASADPVAPPAAGPAVPDAPAVTALGSTLSIRTARGLADELRGALQSGAVRVDASGVEQVDTAGMQLLVATVATAGARGVPFAWTGVSAALRETALHLGLGDALRFPATG